MLKSIFISGREVNYPRNKLMVSAIQSISQATVIGSYNAKIYKGGVFQFYGKVLLDSCN